MKPHMLAGPSRKRSLPDTHGEIVPRKRTSLSREPRAPQEEKNESFRTPEPPHTNNLTQECFRDNHVDVATTAVPSKRRCFMCLRSLGGPKQLMMVCRKAKHRVCCSCYRKHRDDDGHTCVYPGCSQRTYIRVPPSQIRRVATELNYQFNTHCMFTAYGCQYKSSFLDIGAHMRTCPHRPMSKRHTRRRSRVHQLKGSRVHRRQPQRITGLSSISVLAMHAVCKSAGKLHSHFRA